MADMQTGEITSVEAGVAEGAALMQAMEAYKHTAYQALAMERAQQDIGGRVDEYIERFGGIQAAQRMSPLQQARFFGGLGRLTFEGKESSAAAQHAQRVRGQARSSLVQMVYGNGTQGLRGRPVRVDVLPALAETDQPVIFTMQHENCAGWAPTEETHGSATGRLSGINPDAGTIDIVSERRWYRANERLQAQAFLGTKALVTVTFLPEA